MVVAQGIGGGIFALFGGQHLVILITTAPVVIFTYIIKEISDDLGDDFFTMYWLETIVSVLCNIVVEANENS